MFVILLGESEVNQNTMPVFKHHVLGLYIHMEQFVRMHVRQCRAYLAYVRYGFILRQSHVLGNVIVQALTIQIFHHIIGRVVVFETFRHLDDIGMVEFGQMERLLHKLLCIFL